MRPSDLLKGKLLISSTIKHFKMKKFASIFALITLVSIIVTAQPQLTWQFANFEVINAGTQLQFDIEVKADVAGTDHRDLQVYFDYNTAGFGSDIVANGYVTVTPLTLMNDYYFIVNTADNTSSKFAVITEATHEMTEVGGSGNFNLMPTTFTGLLQITIDIMSNTETAGIAFDDELMDGGQYYQETGTTNPIKYDETGLYDNDLLTNKLSTAYGTVTYANASSTALSDVTVTLDVFSDVTDANGDYNISSIDDGGYTLESSTLKTWGGLSMNDVQFTRQKVANQPPGNGLTGLQLLAGDVDQSGLPLNMNDVQFMRQKVAGQLPGFTPFWIFEEPGITVTNGIGTQSFKGICAGDTDASYVPPVN
jgi:hypothetical protein